MLDRGRGRLLRLLDPGRGQDFLGTARLALDLVHRPGQPAGVEEGVSTPDSGAVRPGSPAGVGIPVRVAASFFGSWAQIGKRREKAPTSPKRQRVHSGGDIDSTRGRVGQVSVRVLRPP